MKKYIYVIGLMFSIYGGIVASLVFVANTKFVLLWTDALIIVLVLVISIFAVYAKSKPHLSAPWIHVVQRPLAMSALVVLITYMLIGLLDSIHFRIALEQQDSRQEVHYSGDVKSIFDLLTAKLDKFDEKSYSAPFATHLYVKETIETTKGTIRDFPRLEYGGSHLDNPLSHRTIDVQLRSLIAVIKGLIYWIVICALFVFWLAGWKKNNYKRALLRVMRGRTRIPWRVILVTLGFIVLAITFVYEFAGIYHILGTDKVGQDVLYLTLKSIRTGLVIGTLTTLIMLPFAILLGIIAGHYGGWVDDVVQYIYTTLNSIPGVLLIAAAILSLQVYIINNPDLYETILERADLRLVFLCAILGIMSWTGLCRLLRGETLKLRELDYIQAAQSLGVSNGKIIIYHILPNVMHIVLIAVVLDFSSLVLAEAVLSYVGVGVDPITISWGNMINNARLEMAREPVVWWSLVAAFIFMFALVLSANLFSDAVRDAFDPKVSRVK